MLIAEMQKAFDLWSEPTGIQFVQMDEGGEVMIDFTDRSDANETLFDGPGGALANATSGKSITFDNAEKWELVSKPHAHRKVEKEEGGDEFWADASIFLFQSVAIHEVGHLIGLGHSTNPKDVMSPYYNRSQLALTDNDKAVAKALYA